MWGCVSFGRQVFLVLGAMLMRGEVVEGIHIADDWLSIPVVVVWWW